MKKETVENQLKLDIRGLKASGFRYGARLNGKLFYDGSAVASFVTDSNGLILNYTYLGMETVHQYVHIDWQNCNYGNKRPYFLCPCCGRKVMTLFCVDKHFHCRKCCNLAYKSQSESRFERLICKSNKIEDRLRSGSAITRLDRPKGMHSATYQRLIRQYASIVGQF